MWQSMSGPDRIQDENDDEYLQPFKFVFICRAVRQMIKV